MNGSAQPSHPDDALTVRVRHKSKYVLVAVAGEIDIASVAPLRERLRPLAASPHGTLADTEAVCGEDAPAQVISS